MLGGQENKKQPAVDHKIFPLQQLLVRALSPCGQYVASLFSGLVVARQPLQFKIRREAFLGQPSSYGAWFVRNEISRTFVTFCVMEAEKALRRVLLARGADTDDKEYGIFDAEPETNGDISLPKGASHLNLTELSK